MSTKTKAAAAQAEAEAAELSLLQQQEAEAAAEAQAEADAYAEAEAQAEADAEADRSEKYPDFDFRRRPRFGHVVDKGIPIPRTRGISAYPYPFDTMEVGDSLFVEPTGRSVNISNVKAAAEKRVPGTKWTTRKVVGGFRIWRTS